MCIRDSLWSVAYDNGWQSVRGLGSAPLSSEPEPDLMLSLIHI